MSLKRFVQKAHVRSNLEPFRPAGPLSIPRAMQISPRGNDAARIGTAFDYLLRFELQRRTPKAEAGPWVAEYAEGTFVTEKVVRIKSFDELYQLIEQGRQIRPISDEDGLYAVRGPDPRQKRASSIRQRAERAVATYRRKRKPSNRDHVELAGHALRLASLDVVRRANLETLPPGFDETRESEVAELVDLLGVVPFDEFITGGRTLLNPTFGAASGLVGGADADLIVGDMLIDIKTVRNPSIETGDLDQLLGYFILARHARRADRSFPLINRLAVYSSRHGYLWRRDVSALHGDREFLTVEQWFVDEAEGRHASGTACDMCPTPGEGKNCARCFALDLPRSPQLADPRIS